MNTIAQLPRAEQTLHQNSQREDDGLGKPASPLTRSSANGVPAANKHSRPRLMHTLSLLAGGLLPLLAHQAAAEDYVGDGSADITGGSWDSVYGVQGQPRSGDAEAETAHVTVSGGTINNALYGGYANSTDSAARAGSNSVSVTGLSGSITSIYGGYARSSAGNASASSNRLSMSGTLDLPLEPQLFGGYAFCRNATGGRLLTTNNRVNLNLNKGVTLDLVVGGRSRAESSTDTASASYGNIVSVAGGNVMSLYGGWATADATAEASNNTLLISGGQVAYAVVGEAHSFSGDAIASGNVISVTGGTVGSVIAASVQSDTTKAIASDNAVYLSNTTVTGGVSGGLSTNRNTPCILNNNSVVVGAGAVVTGDVHGGDANQPLTVSGNSASYNTIAVVDGGQVNGEIVGGNLSGGGDALHNTILVRDGSVSGDIIGGRTAAGGSATDNGIIIGRRANLAETLNLFGGEVGGQVVSAQSSGNSLIIDGWQGTVKRAAGFANLHFVLPAPGSVDINVPMLTVTDAQANDFTGATVTAQLPAITTGGTLHVGETFELVHDSSGAISQVDVGGLVSLEQGYATVYDGVIAKDSDSVYIRIDGKRPNPLAGALTEARIGAAGLLNLGGDLLAGATLNAADTAARATKGWALFTITYGGTADLTRDCDITTRGMSFIAGLARQHTAQKVDMLAGAFFESGFGNMSTERSFGWTGISGSGDVHYTGGGLIARMGVLQGTLSGLYVEASGRVGEVSTSWASGDLLDNLNRPAAYDLATPYAGGHIGIGYERPINEKWTLDLSSQYLYLHQSACRTGINGERFRFSSVDSGRLRCGARLTGRAHSTTDVYLSAAWEQELIGRARARSESSMMEIPSTSMRGGSALFDIGMTYRPETLPALMDFAIQGAAGTRRSIGARLQIMVAF